uniref:Uncharacterized protein n=1 Tax=Compsopogon caeruleus TaxID=31354 RepID=A0A7S1XDW2_9RHOD|mmetsp:Transcript_15877/g.31849  ORF Transcript_15877/g.31849 Transcript_15877/m.31849 type:complete len:153 (+) Transcript_15877:2003-2461(+)
MVCSSQMVMTPLSEKSPTFPPKIQLASFPKGARSASQWKPRFWPSGHVAHLRQTTQNQHEIHCAKNEDRLFEMLDFFSSSSFRKNHDFYMWAPQTLPPPWTILSRGGSVAGRMVETNAGFLEDMWLGRKLEGTNEKENKEEVGQTSCAIFRS